VCRKYLLSDMARPWAIDSAKVFCAEPLTRPFYLLVLPQLASLGFETGLNGGLCGGYRFKFEFPLSEESIIAIIRNLCEIAQEGWLSEELLRRDARQLAGWIVLGVSG
jgi:hypothetical protein